ncbi:MAG: PilN domain-containing protein, partial [bacterium]|nr:PilN domain-containing protein [bacterium]
MIKINLAIKEEKQGKLPQEWIVVGFFSAVVFLVMLGITVSNNRKISKVKEEIVVKKAEQQKLEKIIASINELKNQKDSLEKKNKVIDELNRGRQLWPKIMRMLVETKPEQLWINAIAGDSKQLKIDGSCFSHLNVAQFMENLKNDPLVANVVLQRTVAGATKSTSGGEIVTFTLQVIL